ncbi:hypothetical protein J2Z31_005774 [Sinorhizobium kostiense]|uniref:Uncharacterized protein n=1 Tax=Sinorhizobium kostiense TaxID=76747 RepID=A0ABS4R8K7_9HYPH|nr:hypothetical protein [Sinorhizobium kostiense]MBP2239233.1 hypothetical protein [Sinorhizobium kostiense]
MSASKAIIQSRISLHAAGPIRRPSAALVPHSLAILAAFAFVSALVIGAI